MYITHPSNSLYLINFSHITSLALNVHTTFLLIFFFFGGGSNTFFESLCIQCLYPVFLKLSPVSNYVKFQQPFQTKLELCNTFRYLHRTCKFFIRRFSKLGVSYICTSKSEPFLHKDALCKGMWQYSSELALHQKYRYTRKEKV